MTNLTASATCVAFNGEKSWDQPQGFKVEAGGFPTREAAQEFVDRFPKSARFRIRPTSDGFGVTADASLTPNGSHGDINEAGLKRWVSILRVAERAGVPVAWEARWPNAYPTVAAFEQAAGL